MLAPEPRNRWQAISKRVLSSSSWKLVPAARNRRFSVAVLIAKRLATSSSVGSPANTQLRISVAMRSTSPGCQRGLPVRPPCPAAGGVNPGVGALYRLIQPTRRKHDQIALGTEIHRRAVRDAANRPARAGSARTKEASTGDQEGPHKARIKEIAKPIAALTIHRTLERRKAEGMEADSASPLDCVTDTSPAN